MSVFSAINTRFLGQNTWPPPGIRNRWQLLELYAAFRVSNEVRLKQEASIPWSRRYLVSPVPRLISRSKANLLFGEPPEIKPAAESDQENMERLVRENALGGGHAGELHRAAMMASSEEEVWGRIVVDASLADAPIVEFCSPRMVIPRFRGRFVVGATFVQQWQESSVQVVRLLEDYEPGLVRSRLYRGTLNSLGVQIPLDSYAATKGREEEVPTGFDAPLCAFIPNSIDANPAMGFGDYRGLEQRFLAINETATIAQENMRLVGKKRALVDAKYLRNGRLPEGDDVYVRSDDEATAGDAGKPLQMVEYTLEAEATKTYLDSLIDTTLTFGGSAPQMFGRGVEGGAISGTAQKLKMVHSLMEASGTGGYFDRGLARLLRMAAVVDSRRTTEGGFGRRWQQADEDPSIRRGDGLPRDDQEAAQWLVLVTGSDAISLEEKVVWLHPDWTDDQRAEEVKRIREEQGAAAPARDGDEPPAPPVPANSGEGDPAAIPTPRPDVAPTLPGR